MAGDIIAGVAGAGVFGGYHARKYATLPGVRLGAVYDIDEERAAKLAGQFGATPYTDFTAFLKVVDAATIASPASTHYELARTALEAGRHVLIEKPIALRLDHADHIAKLASEGGLAVQVGHQERFVFEGFGILSRSRAPKSVICRRRNPATGRGEDVSVVFDLMIHDLDLVRRLGLGEARSVAAMGDADNIEAEIEFTGGASAIFEAGRGDERRDRRMTLVYEDGVIEIDFLKRSISNSTGAALSLSFEDGAVHPAFADPLGHGVARFIEAVRGEAPPAILAGEARDALEWALMIEGAATPFAKLENTAMRARA